MNHNIYCDSKAEHVKQPTRTYLFFDM